SQSLAGWVNPALLRQTEQLANDLGALGNSTDTAERLTLLGPTLRDAKSVGAALGGIAATRRIDKLLDLQAIVDQLLSELRIPTSMQLTYDWQTPVKAFPQGASAIFAPSPPSGKPSAELSVSSLITVDVRGRRPPEVSVKASLDPFAIQLFGQPDSP